MEYHRQNRKLEKDQGKMPWLIFFGSFQPSGESIAIAYATVLFFLLFCHTVS